MILGIDNYCTDIYIIFCTDKPKGSDIMCPAGRPKIQNGKRERFEIRMNEELRSMLEYCCEKTTMSKTDVVRLGIKKVYDEIKEK